MPTRSPADVENDRIRSITEVGEHGEVFARDDSFAANGISLAAHKLKAPLDLLLAATHSVSEVCLARDIDIMTASDSIPTAMPTHSGASGSLESLPGQVRPPAAASFRLTVMRHDRRKLFDHSLRGAIIAHHIGIRMGLSAAQQEDLLLASLCHDFGEMHTDLEILVQAVLQHHEHLDGNGYPSGETGNSICLLVRIIVVAETFEAIERRCNTQRFDITFQLSRGRLDGTVINALYGLLPERLHSHRAEGSSLQAAALRAGLSPDLLRFLDLESADTQVLDKLILKINELGKRLLEVPHEIDRKVASDAAGHAVAARVVDLVRSD